METTIGGTVEIDVSRSLEVHKAAGTALYNKSQNNIVKGVGKFLINEDADLTSIIGDVNIESKAGKVNIKALNMITLAVGANKIIIGQDGIKLQCGPSKLTMNSGSMNLKSPKIDIKATGMLTCKGTPGGQYK